MPGPWKHPATGAYYFRQRIPSDLKTPVPTGELSVDVAGTVRTVKISPIIKVSLGTKDPQEAKFRYRDVDASVHAFWRAQREGSQPLNQKQIQALAGLLYGDLLDELDEEPGDPTCADGSEKEAEGITNNVANVHGRRLVGGSAAVWSSSLQPFKLNTQTQQSYGSALNNKLGTL